MALELSGLLRCSVALVALLLLAACGGESGLSGPNDDGGGSTLRPGLTVTVTVEPEASSIAQALGWTGGVPNAEVRIHRIGTDFAWETVLTDGSGTARFPNAIAGQYRVAGYRPLTDAEVAQADGSTRALGDGVIMNVARSTEATLRLNPTQGGSLVISEVYGTAPFSSEINYDFHMYIEIYNNSDQTVFLDGMVLGTNIGVPNFDDGAGACEFTAAWRTDPRGLWAAAFHQFPGSGGQHPLGPGQIAVIARDAVDHSDIDIRFPDMSNADFEFLGPSDVDNPDVQNMPEAGVFIWPDGHGLRFFVAHNFFLADRLEVNSLERGVMQLPGVDVDLVLFPNELLLDVMSTEDNDALQEQRSPPCGPAVPIALDRLSGGFIKHGVDLEFSVQRLVIGTVNGRDILQDTNTSAVDLVRALFTPGHLP